VRGWAQLVRAVGVGAAAARADDAAADGVLGFDEGEWVLDNVENACDICSMRVVDCTIDLCQHKTCRECMVAWATSQVNKH